jgi:hypothetical protein
MTVNRSTVEPEGSNLMTINMRLTVALLVGIILGATINTVGMVHARATVGGCKEAYTAPHSVTADRCREAGWTIRVRPSGRGIIVSPRHVIRYLWLPQCLNEDGSAQRSACTWNVTLPYQGDGMGRAFWVDWHDRIHYVVRTLEPQHLQD